MTTANKVTILRILLIPVFVTEILTYVNTGHEVHYRIGILCFAIAAICDGVDGYIARRYNQRSELGAILDPLADKLLLVSAIVFLSFEHKSYFDTIPLWLTGTIIGRDILLLAGVCVVQMTIGKVTVRPRFIGKLATVLQMILVLWILLKRLLEDKWPWSVLASSPHFLPGLTLAAGVATGIAGLLYVWDGSRQLSAHPSSSPQEQSK